MPDVIQLEELKLLNVIEWDTYNKYTFNGVVQKLFNPVNETSLINFFKDLKMKQINQPLC